MNHRNIFLVCMVAIITLSLFSLACEGSNDDDDDDDDTSDDDLTDDDQTDDDDDQSDDDVADHPWNGSGRWEVRTPMPLARSSMAVAAADGLIYLMGGMNFLTSSDRSLDSVDIYDPINDLWSSSVPLLEPRSGAAVGVIDDRIYLAGGFTYELSESRFLNRLDVFDPQTGLWTELVPMPTARSLAAGSVHQGKFYVIGGRNDEGKSYQTLGAVEVYDPSTNEWTTLPSLAVPREAPAATVVGETILLGGGWTGTMTGYLTDVLVYNLVTNEFSFTSLSEPRCSLAAATLWDRYAVFAGGYLDAWPPFRTVVDAYDLPGNQWVEIADLPDGRGGLGLAAQDDRLFAFGGGTYDEPTHTAWMPTADVWEFIPD